jgi:hypothetical protein
MTTGTVVNDSEVVDFVSLSVIDGLSWTSGAGAPASFQPNPLAAQKSVGLISLRRIGAGQVINVTPQQIFIGLVPGSTTDLTGWSGTGSFAESLALIADATGAVASQRGGQSGGYRVPPLQAEAQGLRHRRHEQGGITQAGQFQPPDAVTPSSGIATGCGQGQAALAYAPSTDDGDQAVRVAAGLKRQQVVLPSEQRGPGGRQIAPRGHDLRRLWRVHGQGNALALACDGGDSLSTQQLAQHTDLHGQLVLLDHQPCPPPARLQPAPKRAFEKPIVPADLEPQSRGADPAAQGRRGTSE